MPRRRNKPCFQLVLLLPAIDDPAFHDERDMFDSLYVLQRISHDRNDVGIITGFEHAYIPLPVEQLGPVQQIRTQRRKPLHAVLYHQHEFARLRAVWKWTYIRPYSHRNAGSKLPLKFTDMIRKKLPH